MFVFITRVSEILQNCVLKQPLEALVTSRGLFVKLLPRNEPLTIQATSEGPFCKLASYNFPMISYY